MNVRFKLLVGCCALLTPLLMVEAQRRPPEVPKLAVMNLKSADPEFGYSVAEMLRDKIRSEYAERDLTVVPVMHNNAVLTASEFDTLEALQPYDEAVLAQHLKASEYVSGTIERGANNGPYRVRAFLNFSRGKDSWTQPLPVAEDKKLNKALDLVRDAVSSARKQIAGYKECIGKGISRDFPAAVAAGRAGVAAYPQSTLARLCVSQMQFAQIAPAKTFADSATLADTAMVTIRDLLQVDSMNVPALKMAVDIYRFKSDTAQLLNTLSTLVRADTSDMKLMDQVIFEFAKTGNSKKALPIVRKTLEANPGDPGALRSAFVVFYDAEEYASVIEVGPKLIQADTTAADSSYYLRMAHAYTELQQPQKAAEVYAQASAKFPQVERFALAHYKALVDAGQIPQATNVLQRFVERDTTAKDVMMQLLGQYISQTLTDSVYSMLKRIGPLASVEEKQKLSLMAVGQSSKAIRIVFTSGEITIGANEKFRINLGKDLANLAIELDPQNHVAKLVQGNAALTAAQVAATEAGPAKSCTLAQKAKEELDSAKRHYASIPATSSELRAAADGNKSNIEQLEKAIQEQIKVFCKGTM